jgi:hypothetical protein
VSGEHDTLPTDILRKPHHVMSIAPKKYRTCSDCRHCCNRRSGISDTLEDIGVSSTLMLIRNGVVLQLW